MVEDTLSKLFDDRAKAHASWYFKNIRWIVNLMLDLSERIYIEAMTHGQKHGYADAQKERKIKDG